MSYYTRSLLWSSIAKILDASIKFLTIPFLLSYFGKENYGLLTLAIATNAYMQLLDMGMNTGGVKFFSQWLVLGKYKLIDRVARTNITFYLLIGLFNSTLLIIIAVWGEGLFKLTYDEFITFSHLLYILSAFSMVNWLAFVFNQLLIADEKIGFTQQMLSVRSILNLAVVWITIEYSWSILQYFFSYLIVNALIILPNYYMCHKQRLISSIIPAFYWKDFSLVFKYGLAILAISLFQFTATQSRPLILGVFSNAGVAVLTEYRIMEVFPIFIISLGGILTAIFLPKMSKAIQSNNQASINKLAYEGTRYTSILVAALCYPVMLNTEELLILYVGKEYSHLAVWLMLWIFTLTIYLHNTPVASLVLATGKTKLLVYSSAIACVVSIFVNIVLCNILGVGSVVIGYLSYITIQVLFYYLYFNNKVLGLKSMKVFVSFIKPSTLGFFVFIFIYFFKIKLDSLFFQVLLNSAFWILVYSLFLVLLKMIDIKLIIANLKQKSN